MYIYMCVYIYKYVYIHICICGSNKEVPSQQGFSLTLFALIPWNLGHFFNMIHSSVEILDGL